MIVSENPRRGYRSLRLPLKESDYSRFIKNNKHYIAMTVGGECILGAEMTDSASESYLTEAYGVFAKETRSVDSDYAPETVNTDGWTIYDGAVFLSSYQMGFD